MTMPLREVLERRFGVDEDEASAKYFGGRRRPAGCGDKGTGAPSHCDSAVSVS